MAKLKAVVAKIEDVEEKARDYYTKGADDRFYLDAEGVDDLPVVVGLKRNRDELKSEKLRVEQQRSTDIAALETKIAALEKGNGGGKNDEKIAELENRIKQLTTTSAAEIAARDSQLAKGADAQRRYIRNAEITKALAKQRGNPKFLAHLIEGQVKVDLDGENYRVQVVDARGDRHALGIDPRTLADAVLGIDGGSTAHGLGAEIGAPGLAARPSRLRQGLALPIRPLQPAQIGALVEAGAGNEEGHVG